MCTICKTGPIRFVRYFFQLGGVRTTEGWVTHRLCRSSVHFGRTGQRPYSPTRTLGTGLSHSTLETVIDKTWVFCPSILETSTVYCFHGLNTTRCLMHCSIFRPPSLWRMSMILVPWTCGSTISTTVCRSKGNHLTFFRLSPQPSQAKLHTFAIILLQGENRTKPRLTVETEVQRSQPAGQSDSTSCFESRLRATVCLNLPFRKCSFSFQWEI